jgi:hypothetical protein
MNANTALKINDAINQAIMCGEDPEIVLEQVHRAMRHALEERAAQQLRRFNESISSGRETWKA